MSKEITDAMLAARAIASASERYDKIMERDLWLAWKESHLAALEVERESLRILWTGKLWSSLATFGNPLTPSFFSTKKSDVLQQP